MNTRRLQNLSDERRTLVAPKLRIRSTLSQRTLLIAKTLSDRIVILAPPLRFLSLGNYLSFILLRRSHRSSNPFVRRRELARNLRDLIIRLYIYYKRLGKNYLVGSKFDRYFEYIASKRKYNLAPSLAKQRRIEKERIYIFS